MQPLENFWRALEQTPGLSAVRAEWQRWLGDDYPWVERHLLRPTGVLATVYPSAHGEPYRIVDHGAGWYRAVHPDGEPPFDLTLPEITILRLDVVKLAGLLCAAFGFKAELFVPTQSAGRHRIGTWRATNQTTCPVWLSIQPDQSLQHDSLRHLPVEASGPFIVLTPGAITDAGLAPMLVGRGVCVVPLSECTETTGDGSLRRSPVFERVIKVLRRTVRVSDAGANVEEPNVFRREGEVWTLRFNGGPVTRISNAEASGLAYIHEAILSPRRPLGVVDLDARIARMGVTPRPGSAGEVLDQGARLALRERFDSLQTEIAEAERHGDESRQERLRGEQDKLATELSASTGLGGRARIAGDDAERIRKRISMAISRAITVVGKHDSPLAHHLEANLTTGRDITYVAEPYPDWAT